MSAEPPAAPSRHRWLVPPEATEQRLDRHVAEHLDVPRNRVQSWIREGRVRVDDCTAKASTTLRAGDRVCVEVPQPSGEERLLAEEGELVVLFEDDEIIVLDKPPGLAVHPGAGRTVGTLAHRLLGRYPEIAGVGGPGRPGIVHRLDLGTSGVMVVARTDASYRWLSACFAQRTARKEYLAIAWGRPDPPQRRIDLPIGRHSTRRKEMAVRDRGRAALTVLHTLSTLPAASLLHLDLATGRTHQIRVHTKAIGHPLLGDSVYGEERWRSLPRPHRASARDFDRPALHAWRLSLPRPGGGFPRVVVAPPPQDLIDLWRALGGDDGSWPAADRDLPPEQPAQVGRSSLTDR